MTDSIDKERLERWASGEWIPANPEWAVRELSKEILRLSDILVKRIMTGFQAAEIEWARENPPFKYDKMAGKDLNAALRSRDLSVWNAAFDHIAACLGREKK